MRFSVTLTWIRRDLFGSYRLKQKFRQSRLSMVRWSLIIVISYDMDPTALFLIISNNCSCGVWPPTAKLSGLDPHLRSLRRALLYF